MSFMRVLVTTASITFCVIFSREQPQENLNSPDRNEDEQWYDCEMPADLKEGQRTPVRNCTPSLCPPAPFRHGLKFQTSIDDLKLDETDNEDSDDSNESGICPFDESLEVVEEKRKSPAAKRLRREEKLELTRVEPTTQPESKFSELYYLEATGSVSINRQPSSSDEMEKRDCKLLVSYRVNKEDPNAVQIALIVYKSNSKNLKSRRNLMTEFVVKNSASRCRTAIKDREKFDVAAFGSSSSAPPGAKHTKGLKRPMNPVRL